MCDQFGHTATECQWVYTSCPAPNCLGIRRISTSHTSNNPGRKFLVCQHGDCLGGFEWLDEAISAPAKKEGCFMCGEHGHWMKDCPWESLECQTVGCKSKRNLRTSKTLQTQGWRYLKCYSCGSFQWLKDAIKERAKARQCENEDEATVSIHMKLSDFCNTFSKKTTI